MPYNPYTHAGFIELFYRETLWLLGEERVRALNLDAREENSVFKLGSAGSPSTITYTLPYEEHFADYFRRRLELMCDYLEAEAYPVQYPNRKKACAVSTALITVDHVARSDIEIKFTCCSYTHFSHFIRRVPRARAWLMER